MAWESLPMGQAFWGPAGQSPWRQQPSSAAATPVGAAPGATFGFGFDPSAYTPAGVSGGIPGFNPLISGGGFYPGVAPTGPVQQAPVPAPSAAAPRFPGYVDVPLSRSDPSGGIGNEFALGTRRELYQGPIRRPSPYAPVMRFGSFGL